MGFPPLRALDFKVDVPVEVKTQDEMKRYFATELEREYGDEKLKKIALAYSKLARVPYPTTGGIRFVLEQIAARDPRAKNVNPEAFMDLRFVKQLDESGFIKRLYPPR